MIKVMRTAEGVHYRIGKAGGFNLHAFKRIEPKSLAGWTFGIFTPWRYWLWSPFV